MSNQERLIAQMQQPDFYPHAVAESIELIQTHASYILLTGKYAYKVKKEVNLGFLDYSTLARRKYYLETELQLNRQIAPELYLEVIPISYGDREAYPKGNRALKEDATKGLPAYVEEASSPQVVRDTATHKAYPKGNRPQGGREANRQYLLGNSEEVAEYTLKMHQFPQENLFSNLLAAGKLSGDRFRELGTIVAQFHNQAASNDYISSFGKLDQIRAAFEENYQQSRKYIGVVQTIEQFEFTSNYTSTFFTQKQDLFQARVETHKIRECHGDLHLGNICLWHNQIQLFDRIEFNQSFRYVDTMYDIAFTIMDLEAKHDPDLANIFLNSYLEYTGDWMGLLVLPLYLSRQAYVRGKVNSFLLDDPQVSPAAKQQAKTNARNYYRQAYKYCQSHTGSIILMSGLSGSGKSTVAQFIAQTNGGIQIRSDAVRKHLAGISLDTSGTEAIYSQSMTEKTYARLLELGIILATAGYQVILDAKYDRLNLRQAAIERAKQNQIPLKIIHCTAPLSTLRQRINQRHHDISDATADLLATQQAKAEDFTLAEQALVTTVDTSQSDWQERLS